MRIIDIVSAGQQADGGTQVAAPSQTGRVEVVKIENKGKASAAPDPDHRRDTVP
ncbi:MAG TPA: hypothetical protein VF204_23590 [Streptosporangiaceae bacterium]